MCKEINEQRVKHAARVLGVSEDHEIVFLANTEFQFIRDSELVIDELRDDCGELDFTLFNEDEVMAAVESASVTVKLPDNLRIVGLAKPDSGKRVYGVVDFTGLV